MSKKLIALAATALFCANASAGFIEYNFTGPLSGGFIQNQDDKSIAGYSFGVSGYKVNAGFQPSGTLGTITGVSTHFRGDGPTNFSAFDRRSEVYITDISIRFWESDVAGRYNYIASYSQNPDPAYPRDPWVTALTPLSATYSGFVFARPSTISPEIYTLSDGSRVYGNMLPVLSPQLRVPEPATLALLAMGAVAVGAARRRKTRR